MDYIQLLKDKQLKATPQRLAVLKILNKHTHPNIDELYENIKKEYPSVSLATVYKNVNTLKDANLITEVNVKNGKMKYDIFIEPHIHVVCDTCLNVYDLPHTNELMEYKKSLELSIHKDISSISVLAHISTCDKCKA